MLSHLFRPTQFFLVKVKKVLLLWADKQFSSVVFSTLENNKMKSHFHIIEIETHPLCALQTYTSIYYYLRRKYFYTIIFRSNNRRDGCPGRVREDVRGVAGGEGEPPPGHQQRVCEGLPRGGGGRQHQRLYLPHVSFWHGPRPHLSRITLYCQRLCYLSWCHAQFVSFVHRNRYFPNWYRHLKTWWHT